MRNVSNKSCRENQNTNFMSINFFPRKSFRLRDNVEKLYSQTVHRWQNTTAHAHCKLNTLGHRHTRRKCNTHCMISGFRRDVKDICAVLEFYTAQIGNPHRRFGANYRPHRQGSSNNLTVKDRTDRSSRNFGTELSLYVARNPRTAQISNTRCFSMATMVTWTRIGITLIPTLPVFDTLIIWSGK